MLAEIHRELGVFDKAMELLEPLSDEVLAPAVTVIRKFAVEGDTVVAEINRDGD